MPLLFVPPDSQNPIGRPVGPVIAGAVVAIVLGLALMLRSPAAAILSVIIIVTLIGVGAIIYTVTAAQARGNQDKPKRSQPGMDMYSMIDRMMDELDPDELDYLRRRLDDRSGAADNDLVESVNDLLDEREEQRRQ
ncbi:MAG: hypothetical protein JNJ61_12945 [Anaerolineae bacterium]|nr:hypothetical protein [Anaerolineae bacterium]